MTVAAPGAYLIFRYSELPLKFKQYDIIGVEHDRGQRLALEIEGYRCRDEQSLEYKLTYLQNRSEPERIGVSTYWNVAVTDSYYIKIGVSKTINYNDYWAKLNE